MAGGLRMDVIKGIKEDSENEGEGRMKILLKR